MMIKDIIEVKQLDGYRLHLRFEDGVEGSIDVSEIVEFTGVFAPLEEQEYFAKVSVNPDLGTIFWPNEADLDTDMLYSLVTGIPLPQFEKVRSER